MSQTPITVTYSLEEVFGQINQKLDVIHQDVKELRQEFNDFRTETKVAIQELRGDIKALDSKLSGEIKAVDSKLSGEIKAVEGEIKAVEVEVKGIDKRLDTQEFINRSVVVGFILAIVAGIVKLFLPDLARF